MDLLDQLVLIDGIGPSKAKQLIKLGLTHIDNIKNPIYYNKLSKLSKLDIKYNICKKIPRNVNTTLIKLLMKNKPYGMKPKYFITPAGSYARKVQCEEDIDFLTILPIPDIVKIIESSGITILGEYISGENRSSMVIKFKHKTQIGYFNYTVKLDIFRTTISEYLFALIHLTGSKIFNIRSRKAAKDKGYLLNQYGLWDIRGDKKKLIKVKDEKHLFKLIGISYKLPEDRNH